MFPNLHLDPLPTEGGGAAALPISATGAPAPTVPGIAPPPASTAPAPAIRPAVPATGPSVDAAEYLALRERLATLEAAEQQRQAQNRAAEQERLAQKGQVVDIQNYYKAELQTKEQQLAEFRGRTLNAEKARALTEALANHPLAYPEAPEDLRTLWAADFEVLDGPGGQFLVRDRTTGRDVKTVVAERLQSPRYANYVRAAAAGGGASAGGRPLPTADPAQQGQPLTFEQQVMAQWKESRQFDTSRPSWQQDYRSQLLKRN